jgi:hypothetical protein
MVIPTAIGIPRFEALLQTSNIGNAAPQAKVIAWRKYQ